MCPCPMPLIDLHSVSLAAFGGCARAPCSAHFPPQPRQDIHEVHTSLLYRRVEHDWELPWFCPAQASPFPSHQACTQTQGQSRGRRQVRLCSLT